MKGRMCCLLDATFVYPSVCLPRANKAEDRPYRAKELNVMIVNVVYNALSLYFIILYSIIITSKSDKINILAIIQ